VGFTLTFTTASSAVQDSGVDISVAEILNNVADRVANGNSNGVVRDANGNTIGDWSLD
jgi:hypothetical protein